MKLDVFVMAAGRSSRFGSPKQLQVISGKPMVLHAIERIKHPIVNNKALVTGAYNADIQKLLPADQDCVYADNWQQGLSASIHAAVEYIDDNATHIMIVLADQIAIKADDYNRLIDAAVANPSSIVAAYYKGCKAVPAIFPRLKLSILTRLSGDKGAGAVLNADADVIGVEIPSAAYDIDTQADLEQLMHTEVNTP